MLIIVKHRNPHRFAEFLFDVETVRSLDVFEVDSVKRGFEQLADFDDLLRIVRVDFYGEDVDIGKSLEQDGFPPSPAFRRARRYRLGRERRFHC
jgi:hypothetical protein